MLKQVLILFISGLSIINCRSQTINQDVRLRQIINQDGQAEVAIPYTNQRTIELLTVNVSILNIRDKIVYISLSPLTVEWFILQNFQYQIVEKAVTKRVVSALNMEQAMSWDKYPTHSQYDSIMQSFVTLYPSLCNLDTIGTSIEGKLILALKITGNTRVKPAVFYTSTMHGDETGGFVMLLHFADYLLNNYSVSSRVKTLVDSLEIWINPLSNPDGTYRIGNTIVTPTRYNAAGYDLNRNFPDPFTPNTVTQKETLDMIRFLRKHKFVLSANFHAGVEVVNYPWDRWLSKLHADDSWFHDISRSYADTVHKYAGPAYMNFLENGITRGALWYLVYGGRQDFITSELQGREVTIELDDQLTTPETQLTLLWQNNYHSLLGYLENALYGIHGLVRNINSHTPVPAKIFISGYDKDSSQVYSDTLNGNFVRFLSPGLWNLTFSANGYKDTTITNVIVISGQETELTVDMVAGAKIEHIPRSSVLLYPNPAKDRINALLPDDIDGNINIRIYNQTGKLLYDYNTQVDKNIPIEIELKSTPRGLYLVVFKNIISGKTYHGKFVVTK